MGRGKFILPKDHKPFMKVAKGGSNCSNCKFLTSDKKHCGNTLFVKWYGTDLLPTPVNRYCSDWYEPNPEYLKSGGKITPANSTAGVNVDPLNASRLAKKREHCEHLANSIRSLRGSVTKDLKSEDEKLRLTALAVAIIDKTAERVGNDDSADKGNFGITGLRKSHIKISGNTVYLKYRGKSGVDHEKQFSDELVSSVLKQAIKDTPKRSIFVTSTGSRIGADQVNRYLSEYNITAKDLRGYHANKYIIDKLHKEETLSDPKDRKVVFKKALRYSAAKVGHAPLTLQKHYLFPELATSYINDGVIIDLSDFYSGGGDVAVKTDSGEIKGPSHDDGGVPMVVKPSNTPIEVEGKEYYLCKSALEDDTEFEFHDVTNKEVLDALFQIEGCKYNPKIAHNNDFIVCKLATQDKKIRDRKGTISSILNSMQSEYGCKLTSGSKFTTGGPIGLSGASDVNISVDEMERKRFDIDDIGATLDFDLFQRRTEESVDRNIDINVPFSQLVVQWDGYKYYPQLKDLIVVFAKDYPFAESLMGYIESVNKIFINTHKLNPLYHDNLYAGRIRGSSIHSRGEEIHVREYGNSLRQSIRARYFHEVQHAIQHIEGIPIILSNPILILAGLQAKYRRSYMSKLDFKQWVVKHEGVPYKNVQYNFYKEIPSEKEALAVEQKILDHYKSAPLLVNGGNVQPSASVVFKDPPKGIHAKLKSFRSLLNAEQSFVDKLVSDTGAGVIYNKSKLEKTAREFGINDQNKAKELAELSIVIMGRSLAHSVGTVKQRYDNIVDLYHNQVNLSHRTSQSILLQQYSTPAPIGYLMGVYCLIDKPTQLGSNAYFEPSAGNGLLTIAGDPKSFIVNEVDAVRSENLQVQGFAKVLNQDGSLPFTEYERKFSAVITNPPFGTIDPVMYGDLEIKNLELLMALRGLDTMSDAGKAAIIIGGHTTYDSAGRIQAGKNRSFFVYLYKHYWMEDVINIDGHALYSRQGTAFNTRMILINGRKLIPGGFPPLIERKMNMDETNSPVPVNTFDALFERVTKLL